MLLAIKALKKIIKSKIHTHTQTHKKNKKMEKLFILILCFQLLIKSSQNNPAATFCLNSLYAFKDKTQNNIVRFWQSSSTRIRLRWNSWNYSSSTRVKTAIDIGQLVEADFASSKAVNSLVSTNVCACGQKL